jgi:hypothetical protein
VSGGIATGGVLAENFPAYWLLVAAAVSTGVSALLAATCLDS